MLLHSDKNDFKIDFYSLKLLTYNYGNTPKNKNDFSRSYFEIQIKVMIIKMKE